MRRVKNAIFAAAALIALTGMALTAGCAKDHAAPGGTITDDRYTTTGHGTPTETPPPPAAAPGGPTSPDVNTVPPASAPGGVTVPEATTPPPDAEAPGGVMGRYSSAR